MEAVGISDTQVKPTDRLSAKGTGSSVGAHARTHTRAHTHRKGDEMTQREGLVSSWPSRPCEPQHGRGSEDWESHLLLPPCFPWGRTLSSCSKFSPRTDPTPTGQGTENSRPGWGGRTSGAPALQAPGQGDELQLGT